MTRPAPATTRLAGGLAALAIAVVTVGGQRSPDRGWPTYGGDLASTRYSPLTEIDASTFNRLEVAWRLKTDNFGPAPEFNFQATPLVVGGVMYTTAGTRRAAVAIDAATGELRWSHSLEEGPRADKAPRRLSGRGLAYWSDAREQRILYVTPGYQLVALDARTGARIPGFGVDGIVDLKKDIDQSIDPVESDIGYQAAPVVARDTIIIGAAHAVRTPSPENVKGDVRAFDVRTGKRLWIFHTIPRAGEFGSDTWEGDSAQYTGNTGVWTQMSVDEELGHVYLPVETPTNDFYGGHRPGNNLFGESLVAVDLRTGRRIWHYQLVHHGIWDWDLPCAPILADITVNGRRIKAIAQPTKQGWVYVFDRVTGQPVWPIEERPVPSGDVPGEWYAPTQPFPTKPPAFDRQGVTHDDLIDFTPELRAEAVKLVSMHRLGPIFTPPALSNAAGPIGTLMLPSTTGGANWQGGAVDPETGLLYVFSNTNIVSRGVVAPDPATSRNRFVSGVARATGAPPRAATPSTPARPGAGGDEGDGGGALSVRGLPLVKPPYGRITALDLHRGELVWQIAHGETPDTIRNHPALKGLTIPRTGRQGRIGVLVTKTLVVAGEGGVFTTPDGRRGAMLRAYDKATGADVGAVYMPAPQTGSPMTYSVNGRQYLTVAISGAGYSGELLTFRVPR